MKKSFYLFLILALPTIAIAQTTKKKTTTTTKTTTTVKKTTAPAKKPVAASQTNTRPPLPTRIGFQTFVNNDVIMLNGDFQIGRDYVVVIKDDKKNTLFTAGFNAQSNAQNVSLGKPLAKGSYVITVHEKNNELATGTINLVMN